MPINYSAANLERVRTANKVADTGLCVAFATWDYSQYPERVMETLYAVTADRVLTSTHRATTSFDQPDRVWVEFTGEIPAEAEFIGNYAVPQTK